VRGVLRLQILILAAKWIQHNKLIYCVIVGTILGLLDFLKSKIVQKPEVSSASSATKQKRLKWLIRIIIYCIFAIIPMLISTYYSFSDDRDSINPDGYIKLNFYDGSFSYHDFAGQNVYNEYDIISPRDRSYFEDSIAPLAYITIVDTSNQVVYDGKSEHVESCLIPLKYGTYTVMVSCDNYQKYQIDVSLSAHNKKADVWTHNVYMIPASHIATDIKIQAVDNSGTPYENSEISIGYPGYRVCTTTDENGIVDSLYILAKGEYLLYIDELGVSGRFVINELTDDNSFISVTLN